MEHIIYYRSDIYSCKKEEKAMSDYFRVVSSRLAVEENQIVIPRYTALPFYKELEEDIISKGSKLINTFKQHRWVANLGNWYSDFEDLTPETWNYLDRVPDSAFPIIVKGETNSKKFSWDTHMFAKDRRSASDVMCRLQEDGVIGNQSIFFRKYIPLKTYLIGFRGLPITKEFRIFVYNKQILSVGYYWSNYADDISEKPNPEDIPSSFLDKIIQRVGNQIPFYVVDVAETESGDWIVIELNDGQMSGLSDCNSEELYKNLYENIKEA